MGWSTRELAELAGTTIKAVRHYHEHGLLEEPDRAANGYKQYGAGHLVRLLQVRRLRELGLSLSQIAAMGADPGEDASETLRSLDDEIAERIARLQAVRADLAVLMERPGPLDVPNGFAAVAAGLPEPDRAMLMVYSRLLTEEQMGDVRGIVDREYAGGDDFDALPADADEGSIRRVVEQMAPQIIALRAEHDWMREPETAGASTGAALAQALIELYNPAQVRSLHRAGVLADELQEGSSGHDRGIPSDPHPGSE